MASSTRNVPERFAGGLGALLASQGFATWDNFGDGAPYTRESEWPVFLGPDMPTSPDAVIVITPGIASRMGPNLNLTAQIRLRGSADAAAREVLDQAQAIWDSFSPNGFPLAHIHIGGLSIGAVYAGDVLPLDPDGNRRRGAIMNIRARARRPRPE